MSIVINTSHFFVHSQADFLSARIKINGKVGGIEAAGVAVASDSSSVSVGGSKPAAGAAPVSKRYIKYLTKKFLQKEQVREHVRVIAAGKNDYVVKTIE